MAGANTQNQQVIDPMGIELVPDASVAKRARDSLAGRNIRIAEVADIIFSDSVLALELIGAANQRFFAGDKPSIANIRTALFRLGSESFLTLLDELCERPLPPDPKAIDEYNKLLHFNKRVSKIAGIVASNTARDLVEDAQTIALMSGVGFMLACYQLSKHYSELASNNPRATVIYRLQQDHRIDVRAVLLKYLEKKGIPQSLTYVFDREFTCKTPMQATLRFVVDSAYEITEIFDASKYEKIAPNTELPSKSSLRLLRLSDKQHASIYEECGAYLSSLAVKKVVPTPVEAKKIQETQVIKLAVEPPKSDEKKKEIVPIEYIEMGDGSSSGIDVPEHFSAKTKEAFEVVQELFNRAKRGDEMLVELLQILTENGPFARSALLLVQEERESALIHLASGEGFYGKNMLDVNDPLSPVALVSTSVKSFNFQGVVDLMSPFGVSAYALSPIKINAPFPVMLYADCGEQQSLPFEARRLFRLVVGLLNITLPKLPGGLPRSIDLDNQKVAASI
jgi:hypothetical protein